MIQICTHLKLCLSTSLQIHNSQAGVNLNKRLALKKVLLLFAHLCSHFFLSVCLSRVHVVVNILLKSHCPSGVYIPVIPGEIVSAWYF